MGVKQDDRLLVLEIEPDVLRVYESIEQMYKEHGRKIEGCKIFYIYVYREGKVTFQ